MGRTGAALAGREGTVAKGGRHGAGRNVGRRGRDGLSESLDRAGRIIPHRLGSRTRGTPCRRAFAPTEHLADARAPPDRSFQLDGPGAAGGQGPAGRRGGGVDAPRSSRLGPLTAREGRRPGRLAGQRCWPSPASRRGPRTRTSSPRRHGRPSRRPRRPRRRLHNRGRWWHGI